MTHDHPACTGTNCGITSYQQEHSPECVAEHAAACAPLVIGASPSPGPAAGKAYTTEITGEQGPRKLFSASSAKGGE